MQWCRLYACLDANVRVQAADDEAFGSGWTLVQSFMFLTAAESDGFIPRSQALRFGGPNLTERIAALVRHGLWIPVDGGYKIDPAIWSEERNLLRSWESRSRPMVPADVRAFVMERDGYRCVECGATEDLTLDHLWPWILGGPDTAENLRVLCRPCNSRKGARPLPGAKPPDNAVTNAVRNAGGNAARGAGNPRRRGRPWSG